LFRLNQLPDLRHVVGLVVISFHQLMHQLRERLIMKR
jgi:hypothetical protein